MWGNHWGLNVYEAPDWMDVTERKKKDFTCADIKKCNSFKVRVKLKV